jgi:hypothetical protein
LAGLLVELQQVLVQLCSDGEEIEEITDFEEM